MAERGGGFGLWLGQATLVVLAFVGSVYSHFTLFHLGRPALYPQEPIELWERGAFILAGVGLGVLLLTLIVKGLARRLLLPVAIGTTLGGLAGFFLIPFYLG